MNKFIEYNKDENEIEKAEITQRLAEIKKVLQKTKCWYVNAINMTSGQITI